MGAAATAVLALLGLLGYLPGLRIIGSLRSDYVPMAISTACCFLILAAALFLHTRKPLPGFGLMLAQAPVIFATAFGLLSFAGSFAGRVLNFEDMLFPETGMLGKIPLGHMSPASGAVFVMAGLGTFLLLLAFSSSRRARRFAAWAASLGVMTMLAAATVILSYLYGAPLMYSGSAVPMAATTAMAFLFLGTALVAAAGPESYPMLWLTGDSTSARLSRVFLPLTMVTVLLQGILSRFVTASSRINHSLFLAAMVIVAGAITAVLVVRVAHSMGSSLDESNRKLRESEEQFRTLYENSPLGLYRTTPDGRIRLANPVLIRMLGYSSFADLANLDLERGGFAPSHPRARFIEDIEKHGAVKGLEYAWKRHDGATIIVRESARAIRDARRKTLYYDGIVEDITESKRAEQELRESKALIDAVVENVPLMIFLKEAMDLRFVVFNRAGEELLGYARENLLGKNNLDLFPPEQAAHFQAKDREVLDGEAGILDIPEEHILTAKKGTRLLHTRKVCIRGADGTTKYLLGISEDITERKQAEEEIKRQLTEKEILLKEVHHRIKNNIASIGGLLSLRLQSIANPEAVAVLQEAIGRVDSIRLLYDKLLLSEDYKEISVKNYIENLADAIVALFPGSAKITVEKRIADFPLEPKRLFPLGLIINELITNKMKYAFINRKTGLIKISLANVNNHITLIIRDDGVGLPDGFDMDKSKGFGLMLVKMLSQQLAGSFSIESQAGTRSKIEFDI